MWSYNDTFTQTDLKGNVIWGNTRPDGTADDVAATDAQYRSTRFNSLGYNLVGTAGNEVDFTQEFNATGDQTGVTDAGLGTLANNGGPTQTHALLSGSPALDTGTCTDHADDTVLTDQRGVIRPQGSACDIGAYELEEVTGPVFFSACTFTVNPRNGQH